MRIAALYDIHGNLPALEAVLAEVEAEAPNLVVVGGDVVAGPMPAEVLARLRALALPVRWVMGNADREVIGWMDDPSRPPDGPYAAGDAWVAGRLAPADRDRLAAFEPVVRAGGALFCHGSPRRDDEIVTAITPPARLRPMLAGVREPLVVCGHTHHQFTHDLDGVRVVNAGSVGMPYEGDPAAFWLWLDGGEAHHRRTPYDVPAALARLRATGFPDLEEAFLRGSLVDPATLAEAAAHHEARAEAP